MNERQEANNAGGGRSAAAPCEWRERPILFSGAMVRAILEGRKTQTRRVVKHATGWVSGLNGYTYRGACPANPHVHLMQCGAAVERISCPYGRPGDRLWVRETWSEDAVCMYPCPSVWYRATGELDFTDGHSCPEKHRGRYADCLACWEDREGRKFRWQRSIFMRRHHSRITLEITAVRVDRLQDISPFDALAEGCPHHHKTGFSPEDAVKWYADLWDSINGKARPGKPDVSWKANPWVWVVEFRKLS